MEGESNQTPPDGDSDEIEEITLEPGTPPAESESDSKSANQDKVTAWHESEQYKTLTARIQKLETDREQDTKELQRLTAQLAENRKTFFRRAKSKRTARRRG